MIANNRTFLENLKKQAPPGEKSPAPEPDIKQQYYIKPGKSDDSIGKHSFKAVIRFEDGCEMENIRAYSIIHFIREFTQDIIFSPADILDNDECVKIIREQGFTIYVRAAKTYEEMHEHLMRTIFLKDIELVEAEQDDMFQVMEQERSLALDENSVKIPEIKKGMEKNGREPAEQQSNYRASSVSMSQN